MFSLIKYMIIIYNKSTEIIFMIKIYHRNNRNIYISDHSLHKKKKRKKGNRAGTGEQLIREQLVSEERVNSNT